MLYKILCNYSARAHHTQSEQWQSYNKKLHQCSFTFHKSKLISSRSSICCWKFAVFKGPFHHFHSMFNNVVLLSSVEYSWRDNRNLCVVAFVGMHAASVTTGLYVVGISILLVLAAVLVIVIVWWVGFHMYIHTNALARWPSMFFLRLLWKRAFEDNWSRVLQDRCACSHPTNSVRALNATEKHCLHLIHQATPTWQSWFTDWHSLDSLATDS